MSDSLSDLRTVPEYQAERPHIFRSRAAIDWYVRQNKVEMIEFGALLLIVGQWHVRPKRCDQFVEELGKRQAMSRVAETAT